MRSTTAVMAGLIGLATASPLAARQAQCYSGVYIIAARGSDEDPGQGKCQQISDMVTAQIPDSGSAAVVYPASIADPVYPDSVSDGITNATTMVQQYVDACGSSSRIVLVGFSQGGNVMTDLLAGGVDKPAPLTSEYAQYITAVTVFGDPSFTANQTFDQGTSTSSGIFARGGSSLALLNTYASILQSYCDTNDTFCASGDSDTVHSNEVPAHAQAATDFIVALNS